MKKSKVLVALLALGLAASSIVITSCGSKSSNDPAPTTPTPPTPVHDYQTYIYPTAGPYSFFGTTDGIAVKDGGGGGNIAFAQSDGVTACSTAVCRDLTITYTVGANHYFNAGYQYWKDSTFYVNPTATKITGQIKVDGASIVSLSAFADSASYGGYRGVFSGATSSYQSINIPLKTIPASYGKGTLPGGKFPLSILITFPKGTTPPTTLVVELKDLKFE